MGTLWTVVYYESEELDYEPEDWDESDEAKWWASAKPVYEKGPMSLLEAVRAVEDAAENGEAAKMQEW